MLFSRNLLSSSISVVISLSLVLFVIGVLALTLINSKKVSNYLKENIGFTIMIKENISEIEIIKFRKEIDAASFSKDINFVSKEDATLDLEKNLGEDFVSFLGYSPLLASIDVRLKSEYANTDSLVIISKNLVKNSNVHEVFYQEDLVAKINQNVTKISGFLMVLVILLFIIAFTLINNTIRLSVHSKRFLINTMKLVGATNSFIHRPFITNSFYQGLYGSIFAVFMLLGATRLIQSETAQNLKVTGLVFIIIFISGIVISSISTYFAVKKYIKLRENQLYN